ncbi:MAG: hypothetical protein QOE29_2341, partial [Gaiellaceae bacterium]|nr:hypothetical protein [Gaiellaceae bacterium]
GIGRNWRMVLIAVLGDVAALVAPSRLVSAHGTDALLTEAAVPVAALITCGVLLCIPRPHYVLAVDQNGAFRWSRISDNPSPWSRVFGGRTPWHDPQTSLYEMGVRAPASREG